MFCIELQRGVFVCCALTFGIYVFTLMAYPVTTQGIEWRAQSTGINALNVIEVVCGAIASGYGLRGIRKRIANHVYIFFCFQVFLIGLLLLGTLLFSIEFGTGRLEHTYRRICMERSEEEDESKKAEECDGKANETAIGEILAKPFFILIQLYFTYTVRRLYLIILKEDTGREHSYDHMLDDPV